MTPNLYNDCWLIGELSGKFILLKVGLSYTYQIKDIQWLKI